MDAIEIRVLREIAELEQVTTLEGEIWGRDPRTLAPSPIIKFTSVNGGVALGAYLDGEMIGMSWALPIMRNGAPALWSHISGVLPRYQGQGLGYQLKQAQRDWGRAAGYEFIYWTFDPFQAGNAHFNLRKLGGRCESFEPNFYGLIQDRLNPGTPTDRLIVTWATDTEQVAQHKIMVAPQHKDDFVLRPNAEGQPIQRAISGEADTCYVMLPPKEIKPDAVWRAALRESLSALMAAGYRVVDFERGTDQTGGGWYVLEKIG